MRPTLVADAELRAVRLAKIAKIFAHENRATVILKVLGALSGVPASEAWPLSVSGANRWKHLETGLREFLEISRPQKNQDAEYSVDSDNRERLQRAVDALETLADWSETSASPTLRVSFEDEGLCVLQTPSGGIERVERSQLLAAIALALESIPVR